MEIIKSKENTFIKEIKKLKQKKYRDIKNLFIAEGIKFLDFHAYNPEFILLRKDVFESKKYENLLKNYFSKIHIVDEKIFNSVSTQEHSQGVIAVYKKNIKNLNDIEGDVIILDGISDPGNLGTIIRICDATNFKNIILTNSCVDPFNEKVVRSTMCSIFAVNIFLEEETSLINFLREKKYKIFASSLREDSVFYNEIKVAQKNAIIFGNESNGVNDNFLNFADYKIKIPIFGKAESLNVAVACGIILYKFKEIL